MIGIRSRHFKKLLFVSLAYPWPSNYHLPSLCPSVPPSFLSSCLSSFSSPIFLYSFYIIPIHLLYFSLKVSFRLILATFLVVMIKYLTRNNLYFGSCIWIAWSIVTEKAWQQEHVTACSHPGVMGSRERDGCWHWFSPFYYFIGIPTNGIIHPLQGLSFTLLYRYTQKYTS